MTLHLDHKTLAAGSWTSLDLAAERIANFILKFSDSAPASLEFTIAQAQHTFPVAQRDLLRFWDDAGTDPSGAALSSSNPLFEGYVWECQPAESNLIKYVAYDPSMMAGREIPVMSAAWAAPVGSDPPQPGTGAVPRIIFNNSIDNDVDYAHERAHDQTIGNIISTVLDDAIYPGRWYQAMPGASSAYDSGDMGTFSYVPQEKIVATNESLRAFIDRLVSQHYPEYAFRWEPGTHKWRFYSRLSCTAVTLTLNKVAPANGLITNTLELHRSLEGRYPAIKYYGPETTTVELFSTLDSSLTIVDAGTNLQTYTDIHGTGTVVGHNTFQIANSAKRRGAKLLAADTLIRDSDWTYVNTRSPMLEFSFDSGATWRAAESVVFDFQNGIAKLGGGSSSNLYIYYQITPAPSGTTQTIYVPNAYRLIWAPYAAPLTVRSPSSGYSGTSYTVAGQTSERRIYDEMLAVGFDRVGTPVTTATRIAAFQALADAQLNAIKDITHTGGCQIEGLQYQFCRMSRCINLAAVDDDGNTVTTGWESINAPVSDVEYNFADQTTTLTFSQEALQIFGDNADLLKVRLRIRSDVVQRMRIVTFTNLWRTGTSDWANHPVKFNELAGIRWTDNDLYYNSQTGALEQGFHM